MSLPLHDLMIKKWVLTITPRFLTSLVEEGEYPLGNKIWGDTRVFLPEDSPFQWKDIFTSELFFYKDSLRVGEVFRNFPVALLVSESKE